ncbi:MAG: hypothetical protein GY854_01895 [Deltaproteobacteria bacterium]|nr:hypothetical protein [Deltaproteobacteria bacterium]
MRIIGSWLRARTSRYSRGLLVAIVALAAICRPATARATNDEYDQFVHAKNAYEAGEYKEAVSRFEKVFEAGLNNPALVLECHKLLGVSYLFVGDNEGAERQFAKLLTISPDYELDPMMLPIAVIDFFTSVKRKNQEKLDALARARAAEEERHIAEEEARRKAEIERLTRNIYLERSYEKNSMFVAFVPFGAGQFQNGHTVKGTLFLSGELLLTAGAVTTFFLHEGLRKQANEPFDSPNERESAEELEKGYRIANQASIVGLSVLVVTGIIDALYNFEAETVTWKKVPENEVPRNLRRGRSKSETTLLPRIGEGAVGLEVVGRF